MGRFAVSSGIISDPVKWSHLLARFNEAGYDDIYFYHAYAALYSGPSSKPEAFVCESGGEVFFMPWLSRPIDCPALSHPAFDFETPYGYGGPLATSQDQDFLVEAWTALKDECLKRGIVCGFLRLHPLLNNHRLCHASHVDIVNDRETVILTLAGDRDTVWDQYSSSTRGKIRKGEKAGVEVSVRTGPEALANFAVLYETHMKELAAHDDYFFGDTYFQGIQNLGEDAYRVYLAQHEGRILGGALVLLSRRWAHYHLSSSLRQHSSLVPNNMLRHAVSTDLLNGPWEKLHFGGGRTPDPQDSLFKFKAGYSQERAVFRFGKYVADRDTYDIICSWWAENYPHLIDRFGKRFLKYRYR